MQSSKCAFLFSIVRCPPGSTLFPYTTLFRSRAGDGARPGAGASALRPPALEGCRPAGGRSADRSEEHTSELQSRSDLVCRLLLEKKKRSGNVRRRLRGSTISSGRGGSLLDGV